MMVLQPLCPLLILLFLLPYILPFSFSPSYSPPFSFYTSFSLLFSKQLSSSSPICKGCYGSETYIPSSQGLAQYSWCIHLPQVTAGTPASSGPSAHSGCPTAGQWTAACAGCMWSWRLMMLTVKAGSSSPTRRCSLNCPLPWVRSMQRAHTHTCMYACTDLHTFTHTNRLAHPIPYITKSYLWYRLFLKLKLWQPARILQHFPLYLIVITLSRVTYS